MEATAAACPTPEAGYGRAMKRFRRIGVYCGSRVGASPAYEQAATALGTYLAQSKVGLVFGGGNIGLMGAAADAALAAGGEVIGVIPKLLMEKEIAHQHLTELLVVDGMHSRKMIMHTLADAFIGLPGGFGTMDELFEVLTWNQIGYHQKPVGLLNVDGYFDKLLDFFDHMVTQGFVSPAHRCMLFSADKPEELVAMLASVSP